MTSPFTEEEREQVREMLQAFDRTKYLRGQLKWMGLWLLGLPAAAASLITAFAKVAEWWRH